MFVERLVRDARFERLVPEDAIIESLGRGATWGEGPVYLPDSDSVLWSDLPGNRVLSWSASEGLKDAYNPSEFANGHTLDHDGRVLGCLHGSRAIAIYERDGSRSTIVDRYEGKRFNSPNDLVVSSDGAIWFTDPPYGILDDVYGRKAEAELGSHYVFRLDRKLQKLTVVSDYVIDPNGLAFSPDESILYVSDTSFVRIEGGYHHIVAFDVVDGTRLAASRIFAVIEPGVPDGFRVDVEGNVWTSAGDGVHVLDPAGREIGRILLPEVVGNLTFGGPDGQRLFIAATSTLWSVRVGVRGANTPWVEASEPVPKS